MTLETFGRYQLLKKLATGGMAQIYLARQVGPEGFEKLLVLKRILPHLSENQDFITMFLDEARIAARLNHPNVVQIFDLGAQDDSYFIAMEFIHGEDARRVWKQAEAHVGAIPIALVCRIIIEACAGLDYAHKKADQSGRALNIVHRDISPQNILVSFEGGVKIVDFGIAKAADQATVTRSGVLKGKYSYMSPEQAAGAPIDCRTDIFALGVVLYELLTGARLFKRSNDIQTLNAVTECRVSPPSTINEQIPPDLDAIVLKALAKDRTQRYAEARHLGAALEAWLLENRLPSSSAHLAEFLHEIYAERLAREAEEGRLLIETLEASRNEDPLPEPDKATPADVDPRRTKSLRAVQPVAVGPGTGSRARPEGSAASRPSQLRPKTTQELPPRPVPTAQPALPTQTEASAVAPPNNTKLAVIAAVAVLAVLVAGGAVLMSKRAGPPSVRLTTTPVGAQVIIDGAQMCPATPCTITTVGEGPHELVLKRDGFETVTQTLQVPGQDRVDVALTAARAQPPRQQEVTFTLTTQPPGASVTLDGRALGPTPLEVTAGVGASVKVVLELKDYAPRTESFTASAEARSFALEPIKKTTTVVKPPVTPKDPEVKVVGKGTVRFVANPWAVVSCGGEEIGTTPFAPHQMSAGDYVCRFKNPDLNAEKTVSVHVEPGSNQKVVVQLP